MTRYIDLSMPIHEGMQTFPAPHHPFVEIVQLARHGIEDRETRKLVLGTHVGSHIDAPRHFIAGGGTVEDIPLEKLCGPAILLDFSHVPAFTGVTTAMLEAAVAGRSVERVLMRFDGEKRLGTMAYYTDQPYLEEEAAQWLVDQGCGLVGLDVAMPDNPKNGKGSDNDSPVHKILLGAEVVIVEYLVNLAAIGPGPFTLVTAPLKIMEGDGAPARVFAIQND